MLKTIWPFLMALLMLLKAVGILLLVLLLVLIAVLLLVLLVPVRYRTEISNEQSTGQEGGGLASKLRIQLKVTWLFRFIHISICYGADGMESRIRAAGIDVLETLARVSRRKEMKRNRRAEKGQKKHKKHKKQKKQKEQNPHGQQKWPKEQDSPKQLAPSEGQDLQREKLSQEGTSSGTGYLPKPKEGTDPANGTGHLPGQGSSQGKGKNGPNSRFAGKSFRGSQEEQDLIKEKKASRVSGEATGLKAKFSNIRKKLGQCRKELTEEANRNAAAHIWKEFCRLLKSYKPRKLKADISFSLADPALTGGAVGLISLLPFLYQYPCSIVPDFASDRLYIAGEIMAEGKVRMFIFLLCFLRLMRDREFKQVARRLMGRGE